MRVPKPKPLPAVSNAQRCANYRERMKEEDPDRYAAMLKDKAIKNQEWRQNRTEEQKDKDRVGARIRQQNRRFDF